MNVKQLAADLTTTNEVIIAHMNGMQPNREGVNENSNISADEEVIIRYIVGLSA